MVASQGSAVHPEGKSKLQSSAAETNIANPANSIPIGSNTPATYDPFHYYPRLRRVLEFIHQNGLEGFSLRVAADIAGMGSPPEQAGETSHSRQSPDRIPTPLFRPLSGGLSYLSRSSFMHLALSFFPYPRSRRRVKPPSTVRTCPVM